MSTEHFLSRVCVALAFLALTGVQQALGDAKDVNVVNTPDVNVVNAPEAPVPVDVVNTESQAIPVYEANAKEPFQIDLGLVNVSAGGAGAQFTVPEGKRLVIEYVSGGTSLYADAGVLSVFSVRTVVSGVTVPHAMLFTDLGPAGPWAHRYLVGQNTRVYADPQTVVLIGIVTSLGGSGEFAARVSGYLVPAQDM